MKPPVPTSVVPSLTTRRTFLRTTAGAAAFAATAALRAETPSAPVVDTHVHCFAGLAETRFPYSERGPYKPEKPATPEQLLTCMRGAGVDFAVIVHPEPYGDDHRYLEYCLGVGGAKFKATCLFFADRPDSLDAMSALVKRWPGRIAAARVHAYAPDRLPPFGKPELQALWQRATDLGLMMQLHFEPRYAPQFERLIQEFPNTKVLIDHLGRPLQGTPEEYEVVVRWSRFPNTIIKVSALPDQGKYPHRSVAPIVQRLAEAYGPDRMMAGFTFDQDATPETYRRSRDKVADVLGHMPAADQAKVLGGTAARVFAF